MKNAIILHGMASREEHYNPKARASSNAHWLPWLQKQLIVHDIAAQTPEVPNAWHPYYPTWAHEFERFEVTPDTILVGHSRGAAFIVRWLCEHPDLEVGKVVLVAPAIVLGQNDDPHFFDCEIDKDLVSRTKSLTIFHSDNDSRTVNQSVDALRSTLKGVRYREFHEYGHFTYRSMGTDEFPALLETLLIHD
jgi:predicted alpha/beta hydrolase family esterase